MNDKATNKRFAGGILLSLGLVSIVILVIAVDRNWRIPDFVKRPTVNQPVNQQLAFRKVRAPLPFSLTLFKDTSFVYLDPSTDMETVAPFPALPSGEIKHVTSNRVSGVVAFVVQKDGLDVAYLKRTSDSEPVKLLEARHSFPIEQEVENQFINQRPYFSLAGRYLVVQKALWEGCESYLYDTNSAQVVLQSGCDRFVWTSDDRRAARIVISYGEPSHLALSELDNPAVFRDIDWSKVQGANEVLKNYALIGSQDFFYTDFRIPDELILLTGADDGGSISVVSFSISSKSLRKIATFQSVAYGYVSIVGDTLLIVDERQTLLVNLASGSIETFSTLIRAGSFDRYDFVARSDVAGFLLERTFDVENRVVGERLIVINVRDRTFGDLEPFGASRSLIAEVNTE